MILVNYCRIFTRKKNPNFCFEFAVKLISQHSQIIQNHPFSQFQFFDLKNEIFLPIFKHYTIALAFNIAHQNPSKILKFLTNFLNFRTSMEESSHSTPSPMSSAASSQDSLHRNAATLHYHQMHHQNPYGNLMTNTLPGDF